MKRRRRKGGKERGGGGAGGGGGGGRRGCTHDNVQWCICSDMGFWPRLVNGHETPTSISSSPLLRPLLLRI